MDQLPLIYFLENIILFSCFFIQMYLLRQLFFKFQNFNRIYWERSTTFYEKNNLKKEISVNSTLLIFLKRLIRKEFQVKNSWSEMRWNSSSSFLSKPIFFSKSYNNFESYMEFFKNSTFIWRIMRKTISKHWCSVTKSFFHSKKNIHWF